MFTIKNKQESAKLISKLNLNQLPKIILNSYNPQEISNFISKYPAEYYAVRDMSNVNSKLFNLKVKKRRLDRLHEKYDNVFNQCKFLQL